MIRRTDLFCGAGFGGIRYFAASVNIGGYPIILLKDRTSSPKRKDACNSHVFDAWHAVYLSR